MINYSNNNNRSSEIFQLETILSKRSTRDIYNGIVQRFHYRCLNNERTYYSLEQIGIMGGGYSRSTVKRELAYLRSQGLIDWIDRSKDFTSNIYMIPKFIYQYAHKYRSLIPSLWTISFRSVLRILGPVQNMLWKRNEPPYKNNIIISPCKYNIQVKEEVALVGKARRFLNKSLKRGERFYRLQHEVNKGSFMAHDISKLSSNPVLDDIEKTLKLTKLGKAKLFSFDEAALKTNWEVVKKQLTTANNPYELLIATTMRYCENRSIRIDWDIFELIKKRYNIPDDKVYVQPKNTIKKPVVQEIKPEDDIVYPEYKRSYADRFKAWKIAQGNPSLSMAQFVKYEVEQSTQE